MAKPLPLCLTMGEPAGIGGEIAIKAWAARTREAVAPFFLIDDPDRIRALAARIGVDVAVAAIAAPAEADFAAALPVLALEKPVSATPGRLDTANAPAVIESITRAHALIMAGQASAMVTNPIQKSTLYEAGFAYPGHTEFLAALAGSKTPPVMMLAVDGLRVVPVTVHQSLRSALDALSTDAIVTKARIAARELRDRFGIARPRLAVAGVNPHAGEDGTLGREEIEIVIPAIERLRAEGWHVEGPKSPDTMFHPGARATYDVAICHYHDQALIPLKTLDYDHGVNVTLGLNFIRTSPDHGTALDIAGSGTAKPDSLIAALGLAAKLAGNV
ncbi:MAG TPA: 4-hydroxythreonine-4-phosphate dehydrogenase PdxA [Alphaproteobacteria bacterium]|jgi:4-hydroxythreonine-4-phosphate dehydrogenase|nr:4-hydroxythreonine-4-phosphate dehydrogenase PdxA [Alphaproteobacteria bacterium]